MLSMFCTAHSHSHTEVYNVRAVRERFNIDPSLNRRLFCSIGSNIWEGSDNCEKRQPSGAVAGVCVCVSHRYRVNVPKNSNFTTLRGRDYSGVCGVYRCSA